jgi:cytochrome c oxidase subunit 3
MDKTKQAMLLFMASEAIFFVFLLVAFINFHPNSANSGHDEMTSALDLHRTVAFTILLLLSSATAWRAQMSAERKQPRSFQAWLGITLVLGSVFIYGQATEFLRLFEKEITISRNPFSTSFFTVTGFHSIHVLAGLLLLLTLLIWSLIQTRRGRHLPQAGVNSIALYWHFVDIVWVAVFSIVYVWGTR